MRKILGILLLGLLLFGCVSQSPATQNQSVSGTGAKLGDKVTVDYVLQLDNGSIIDTSIEGVAKSAGIYQQSRTYSPLVFKLNYDGSIIPGFVNGVLGMKIGEKKEFTVSPEYGYGVYHQELVYPVPKFYELNQTEIVPRSFLESQNIPIELDKIIQTKNGLKVAIKGFDNSSVTLKYLLVKGDTFNFNGMPEEALNVSDGKIYVKLAVAEGERYVVSTAQGGKQAILVLKVNDTSVTIDENPPLAGKILYFTVTLNSIQ